MSCFHHLYFIYMLLCSASFSKRFLFLWIMLCKTTAPAWMEQLLPAKGAVRASSLCLPLPTAAGHLSFLNGNLWQTEGHFRRKKEEDEAKIEKESAAITHWHTIRDRILQGLKYIYEIAHLKSYCLRGAFTDFRLLLLSSVHSREWLYQVDGQAGIMENGSFF